MIDTGYMRRRLGDFNCRVNDEIIERLFIYIQEIERWNRVFNITAYRDSLDIFEKGVLPSLLLLDLLEGSKDVMDVGSGCGLPGIPLLIVMPSMNVILVEPVRKKASFLIKISFTLLEGRPRVINSRVELLPDDMRGRFDAVVSRGVSKPLTLFKKVHPYLGDSGIFLTITGKKIAEETEKEKKNHHGLNISTEKIGPPLVKEEIFIIKISRKGFQFWER